MFNQKLISILCKVLGGATIAGTALGLVWAAWAASGLYDFAEALGYFVGAGGVILIYGSFVYVFVAAIFKHNNSK